MIKTNIKLVSSLDRKLTQNKSAQIIHSPLTTKLKDYLTLISFIIPAALFLVVGIKIGIGTGNGNGTGKGTGAANMWQGVGT